MLQRIGERLIATRRATKVVTATIAIVVATTAASAVPVAALGDPPDPDADSAVVQRLVFGMSLGRFEVVADRRLDGDQWLDWNTDWCSAPLIGSTGRSFDFRAACRRHDFAYRNTKLLDVRYGCVNRPAHSICDADDWTHGRWWNANTRARIDRRFLADMRTSCRSRRWLDRLPCRAWAEVFYRAVRITGGP